MQLTDAEKKKNMDRKKTLTRVNVYSFVRCSDIAKLHVILQAVHVGVNSVYALKKHIKKEYGLSPSTTVKYLRILENAKVITAQENVNNHNKREFSADNPDFEIALSILYKTIFGH